MTHLYHIFQVHGFDNVYRLSKDYSTKKRRKRSSQDWDNLHKSAKTAKVITHLLNKILFYYLIQAPALQTNNFTIKLLFFKEFL